MTYTSIFICDPSNVEKNYLPESLSDIEFKDYYLKQDLWMYINEKGTKLDWGSSILVCGKTRAINLLKKYSAYAKDIKKVENLDLEKVGLVCEEQ